MTPATRKITEALELVAEMPDDPLLQEAKASLFRAADLVERFANEHDTEPAPPPASDPQASRATIPDGAE